MTSQLLLDRLEFLTVNIRCNVKAEVARDEVFPQLNVDFENYNLLLRSGLQYDPQSANDPRHFALTYGIKLEPKKGENTVPYEVEVDAVAFLRFEGDEHVGQDRFRAVRMSGYQILHGAIREMVANVTSRSRHGTMQLPARNFNARAKADAESDEKLRLERLGAIVEVESTKLASPTPSPSPSRARKRLK